MALSTGHLYFNNKRESIFAFHGKNINANAPQRYVILLCLICYCLPFLIFKRLQWPRGSLLAFGTQVRGFTPGRSRRIFRAKKILSTPSFGGEVKPSAPCRSFRACKRSLNVKCKSAFRQNFRTFLAHSSTFRCWVLSRGEKRGDAWWRKLERLTKIAQ